MAFSFFGKSKSAPKLSVKEFEIWVKEKQAGALIVQERTVCIGTIDAISQEEADKVAETYGGYATVKMDR